MYPKYFFENYWASKQKNQLFVCMPFHNNLDEKFLQIDKVARKLGFDCAKRLKEGLIANDLLQEILDGIGNSRTLLFDLSDDPKSGHANDNVIYELGVATAIREPEDILLIREKSENEIPFNINHLRCNMYSGNLDDDWLEKILKIITENQDWSKSKRIDTTAKTIDSFGYKLMIRLYGEKPIDRDHFNDEIIGKDPEVKLAILRLMDLGILRFETARDRTKKEYAYHWTSFGKEVMKHLGIKKEKIS